MPAHDDSPTDGRTKEGHMQRRGLLVSGLALAVAQGPNARGVRAAAPVVLELFTSQGCSSGPPADALLGSLAREPGVIALAWHVDYWNGLGWHDPYSTTLATARQQRYASEFQDEVYTPALVVNGAHMVVGSDGPAVKAAIGAASGFGVAATLRRTDAGLVAEIGAAGVPVSALVASYDAQDATPVRAGENGGRMLIEYRIVREATPLGIWDGSARRIVLPPMQPGRGAVVLVQGADLRMVAAADLPSA
jgi:hypothetical protein